MKPFPKTIVKIKIPAGIPFWRNWIFSRLVWLAGWIAGASYRLPVNTKWCKFSDQQKWKLLRFWRY